MVEEFNENCAPAVKCSYCEKIIQDSEKYDMGFEADDWAICGNCFIKAIDSVKNEVK